MQTYDPIILNRKVQYLDPAEICEARHASSKWMKDNDDNLMPFKTKKEKQKEKKDFTNLYITTFLLVVKLI